VYIHLTLTPDNHPWKTSEHGDRSGDVKGEIRPHHVKSLTETAAVLLYNRLNTATGIAPRDS
jgi:hypothetical protein